MIKVWKYPLDGPYREVQGRKVVHVGWDPTTAPDTPTAWVEVDTASDDSLSLVVVGTGQIVPPGTHVGSAITPSGLVWHVYERMPADHPAWPG